MSQPPTTERRRSRRRKPLQLVYLEFGRENGGMVKDVSEGGMRFYLMHPVAVAQTLQFSVNLDASRRIEGQAKMIWTEANGKSGGMSFAEISEQSRETLRAWLAAIDGPTAAPLSVIAPAVPLAQPRVPPDRVPTPPAISAPAAQVPAPQNPAVQAAVTEAPASPVRPAPIPVVSAPVASAPVAPGPVARVPVAELPTTQNIPAPSFVAQVAAAPNPAPPIPTELPPVPPAKASPQTPIESPEDVRPVTREDWIRAARENLVPGERFPRYSLPAMALAGPPPTRPPGSTNPGSMNEELQSLVSTILFDKKPPEATATAKFERIAQAVDPLREFLRQPDEDTEVAYTPAEHFATLDDDNIKPPRGVWTAPRLFMVFSFAAICGVAAAFAAIAYRQTLGESLIELGEKIGGQSRSSAPANADRSPASPSAADSQNTLPPADARQPTDNRTAAPASSGSSSPANSPASQPTTPQPTLPISRFRPQSIQPSAIPEPELAAGREIIPGKPKRPPEDVASLWIAVENGDTLAEVHLANRYISGDGVQKNCDQARVLLRAAAKHGDELAAKRLAQLSTSGCK